MADRQATIYTRTLYEGERLPLVSFLVRADMTKTGLPMVRITRSDAGPEVGELGDVIVIPDHPVNITIQVNSGLVTVTIDRMKETKLEGHDV